ncbi:hypothetical protein KGV55_01405 [Candidatus Gracilibacteria bacterium]|nr:hypothetical protein [Candidatus Gracilibacteria bacterium]
MKILSKIVSFFSKRIIILEDQYAPRIAKKILKKNNALRFPIQENIKDPLEYVDFIRESDIILLDNYFPGKTWEEAKGDEFLKKLLKTEKNYKIICISDRGERLCEWYDGWKTAHEKGWILGWCKNKDGDEIYDFLESIKR